MPVTIKQVIRLSTCILLLFLNSRVFAQEKIGLEVDKWAKNLSKSQRPEINSLGSLTEQLIQADSVRALSFLDSLEGSKYAKGYYFRMFFSMVKADFLYSKFAGYDKYKDRKSEELHPIKEQLIRLYAEALNAAYHIEDDLYTGWVNFYSARRMRHFGETSWAVMYSKNGVDLFEKVKYPVEPPVYTDLAELLYQVREYDEAVLYAKKGILAWKQNDYETVYKASEPYKFRLRALNTIGNTFYQKKQLDSANSYFQQALQIAKQNNDTLWTGLCLGNIGRLFYTWKKMDTAYQLFKTDYKRCKEDSLYDKAAFASQWAARASLAQGNTATALAEAREAVSLLQLWPNSSYLRDTYQTLTDIFRALGSYDSAFYYNDRFAALNETIEKEVATSSLAISKARLNDEVSRYNILKLNREKEKALLWRNIVIVSIIIVSIISLLVISRQLLREKIKSEKAGQEKLLMEQEILFAKDQLKMFTENIIEKTTLIEKLEVQIRGKQATAEQQTIITELSQQTILTEEDWNRFKSLFEKIYPGFFINLKTKFPDITLAEQRMAALTRIHLTTKQIASMLGISTDSVHKTRQRLRQRLQIPTESSLEEILTTI